MSTSFRFDASEWIPGAFLFGDLGGGIRGDAIPAGSLLSYHVDLPADAAKEFRLYVTSWPSNGTLALLEDGTIDYTATVAGTYTLVYDLYVDYVNLGSNIATITVGASALGAFGGANAGGAAGLSTNPGAAALAALGGAQGGGQGSLPGGINLAAIGGAQPTGRGTLPALGALLAGYGGANAGGRGGSIFTGGLVSDPRFRITRTKRPFRVWR